MSREILLHLLDPKFNDPMVLVKTSTTQRAAESTYSRRYALNWDPPPDTMFMRATNLDFGVFGEELASGSLQSVEARHSRPSFEAALEADLASTIKALVDYSANTVTPDEVATALATGVWQRERTKQRGAILQAAGFARCLLEAVRLADLDERAVVWEYTGGAPSYKYP
ncbi:MAG: hypothetical protein ACI9KE_003390 [Polyangiales bacterium]|jgi:hypothetical protein